MQNIDLDDLKSAIHSDVITEKQYNSILSIAQQRTHSKEFHKDDEPFSLFLGFSEIFISLGIAILYFGIGGVFSALGTFTIGSTITFLTSLVFFHYFIIKRRMVLPSILSASISGLSFCLAITNFGEDFFDISFLVSAQAAVFVTFLYLIFLYKRYRLPFLTFLIGLAGMATTIILTMHISEALKGEEIIYKEYYSIFDFSLNPIVGIGWLFFGLVTMGFAFYFDFKDPHRIANSSKSAFWLHLLAGPSILNLIAISVINESSALSYILTSGVLLFFILVGLVIDRRSFITAGIIYMSIIMSWAIENMGVDASYGSLLLLGIVITALGVWWQKWRALLLNALPDFKFKNRLPPYQHHH